MSERPSVGIYPDPTGVETRVRREGYVPLEDYGLVGDGCGAALVSQDGSVDWLCIPRFDSPSLFGRVLDHRRGGYWSIGLASPGRSTLRYRERTAILETEHRSAEGTVRVSDFFPFPGEEHSSGFLRLCDCVAGEVELEAAVEPAPEFAQAESTLKPYGESGLLLAGDLRLRSSIRQQEPVRSFRLRQGERAAFVLESDAGTLRLDDAFAVLEDTVSKWEAWSDRLAYSGPYAETVTRGAITLKLLTHAPTGALVAAPTTSLPARLGGEANWDYRYAWLRDSTLALYALLSVGVRREGDAYFDWICARVGDGNAGDGLRAMYDVDGGSDHEEETLGHLEGYERSRPVRIGNAACMQVQMDVYGEVLDLFSIACRWGRSDKLERWRDFARLADWICEHWSEPDNGIWEQRGAEEHYVHSKVMAWAALDRARSVAEAHGLPGDLGRWASSAQAIRRTVLKHGWNDDRGVFQQSFENDRPDAANLLLPLVGFLPPDDPRAQANLAQTCEELATDDLVLRFRSCHDELTAGEGAFTLCSFWRVNALAAAGRSDEAVDLFERACGRSGPLGLFAEHVEISGGRLLGNYPQAFVHAGALTAAVNLARLGIGEAPAAEEAPEATGHLIALPPAS